MKLSVFFCAHYKKIQGRTFSSPYRVLHIFKPQDQKKGIKKVNMVSDYANIKWKETLQGGPFLDTLIRTHGPLLVARKNTHIKQARNPGTSFKLDTRALFGLINESVNG